MEWLIITFAAVLLSVFGLTVLAERVLIPVLKSHKMGQKILEIGPRWHKDKEDTPTMGGICFILATLVVMAVYFIVKGVRGEASAYIPLATTLAFAVGNGVIGFVDDYVKLVIKKENEGLTALQKLFLQLALATAYVCVLSYMGYMDTVVKLPFGTASIDFGWLWYPLAVLLLTGVVNGGNITDGIDGLASAVTVVIGVFFAVWAFSVRDEQLSVIGAALIGAAGGFLVYNYHPAKVFMGDTGSLFFGAFVIAATFGIDAEIVGLLISAVFIIEMLSSFLQTGFFKLTRILTGKGRRIFKMAPLHHHFEKCGWGEIKLMWTFGIVELLFCVIAWLCL
jgi:phospho-N-acetylmuramoyl-pentapeptide-transferase